MLEVRPVPAFDDNYIWMLGDSTGNSYAAVDPGDGMAVLRWLQDRGGRLEAILITHLHGDHTGGISVLSRDFPGIPVYGPSNETIRGVTHPLTNGGEVTLSFLSEPIRVLDTPGHTHGHIAYMGAGALFCGDTLFAAGCGRVFSGTHEQLSTSLRRIAGLPPETLIYCAHEYTLANLGFARWVEPESEPLMERIRSDEAKRRHNEPTLPSTLALELATNPFLRTGQPAVISAAERYAGHALHGHAEVFRALRTWKDREYD